MAWWNYNVILVSIVFKSISNVLDHHYHRISKHILNTEHMLQILNQMRVSVLKSDYFFSNSFVISIVWVQLPQSLILEPGSLILYEFVFFFSFFFFFDILKLIKLNPIYRAKDAAFFQFHYLINFSCLSYLNIFVKIRHYLWKSNWGSQHSVWSLF